MSKLYLLTVIFQLLFRKSLEEDLLSNFYQSKFKLKDMRAHSTYYNKDVMEFYDLRTYKFNRTTAAINLTMTTKFDADLKDFDLLIRTYKFASNQYRPFPMRFQVNFKKAIAANMAGLKASMKCGNFPHEGDMILKKSVRYTVCNIVPDETRFPPLIPTGRYMEKLGTLYKNEEVATSECFAEIYIPIVIED